MRGEWNGASVEEPHVEALLLEGQKPLESEKG